VTAEDWLIKTCGRRTYEKMWRPLLLAKLGESYRRVSAVFIWTYITRLFSARDASAGSKEQLGHVAGGYKTVFDRLAELIRACGGEIRTEVAVRSITAAPGGGLMMDTDDGRLLFDKVVFTGPVNILQEVAGGLLKNPARPEMVEYLGVICVVLLTRRPLVPYYVVNIADKRIPFTGVIGMSTVVSIEETAGLYLTYLPKYVLSDEPFLKRPDDEIKTIFLEGLRDMLSDFRQEDIVGVHVNRAFKVQPLQVLDYSNLAPRVVTDHQDFFVLNTSQFVNGTLNNNEVIRAVSAFLDEHGAALEQGERPAYAALSA
jgi:protoporphyrinogen oxidase